MAFSFHLPDIGEGVVEGEIVSWKVAEGDIVTLDQPIVEVMTDKATVEIPSPRAGRIAKINYGEGQICPVGQVLLVIDDGSATVAPAASKSGNGAAHHGVVAAATVASSASAAVAAPLVGAGIAAALPVIIDATTGRAKVSATPATRRIARQLSVDIATVRGTGKRGRITTDDVERFAAGGGVSAAAPSVARQTNTPISIAPGGNEERIPFRGMRKRIADNMTRSAFTATHFTYVEEVDMTDLVSVRERAKVRAMERGVKLTYLPFIIKAIVSGLKNWPALNASLDEAAQEIVRKKYYHIGIAAQGPSGLVVTVIRDADKLSIFGLSREIQRLAEVVANNTATRDDLTGSTFTISSLGKLGGVMATPIINFPEVGIVGVHNMEEKPAVRNHELCIRWLMNLSISLDHRLVDGWDGAMFLQEVKHQLEDPTSMFLDMV